MRLKLLGRDISKIGFGAVGFLRLPVGELRLDLGLHRIDIEIAHREDGRARWPIILPIKFDEAFARRRADDVHITYWHALGKQRTCGANQIGSASCRERVLHYVEVPVVAGPFKKKK